MKLQAKMEQIMLVGCAISLVVMGFSWLWAMSQDAVTLALSQS